MGMFSSPFEKLTADNQSAMSSSMTSMATSVSKGGGMFEIFSQMLTTLKQIEKNTRISQKGKMGSKAKSAVLMGLIGGKKLTAIGKGLKLIADALKSFDEPEVLEAKMQALTNGLMLLEGVGKSIFKFAGWLVLATPLLIVAAVIAPILGLTLMMILGTLSLVGTMMPKKKLLKTFIMLRMVGVGIFTFVSMIALAGLVAVYALKALPMVALVILGMALLFKLVQMMKIRKSVRHVARALLIAGKAIIMLAAALVLFSLILNLLGDPFKTVMLVGAVVLGVAILFMIMDIMQIDKSMKKTARALMTAGLSIVILAAAIVLAEMILGMNGDPMKSLLIAGLLVGGVAAVFWLVGKQVANILLGAIALVVAGIALIFIGFGISLLVEAVPDIPTGLGMLALITGIGVVFGAAGLIAPFIALGGASMIVAGLALLVLGPGAAVMAGATKGMTTEDVKVMALVIGAIAVTFAAAGVLAIPLALGAGVLVLAGLALIKIGKGLQSMNKALQGTDAILADSGHVTESTLGFGGGRMMSKMEYAIQAVGYSFIMAPWTAAGIAIGVLALKDAGKVLLSIGLGIQQFQKIAKAADLSKLGDNVNTIVDTLSTTFAKVGKQMKGGRTGLMGAIFGSGGTNPVADGISSVMGMGEALTNIAVGFQNMANLKFPSKYDKNGKPIEFETMSSDAPAKVAANTSTIVDSLASVFGKIGSDPNLGKGGKKGLFAQIMSGSGNSPVADGISSVMGMGEALTNVALGFQSMANLRFPTKWNKEGKPIEFEEVDIPSAVKSVLANTTMILLGENGSGGLVGMLSSIGKANGPDKGFFASTDYEKGKEMIQGIGTPIKDLAEGVKNMAALRFANKWDKNGKAIGWVSHTGISGSLKKVEQNIKQILLGKNGSGGLVGIFKKLGGEDDSGWFSASTIEKGADIAKMISKPIKDIASAAAELMSDKWTPEGASARIGAIISALASGEKTLNAGGMFGKGSNPLEETAKFLKAIAEQVDPFEKFTKSFGNYVEDFVKYKDAINAFDPDKLQLTTEMFAGLTHLSKTEDAINNMSEQLAAAIYKLAEMIESTGGGTSTEGATKPAGANPAFDTPAKTEEGKAGGDMSAVVKAIQLLESRLDEPLIVKSGSKNWFN